MKLESAVWRSAMTAGNRGRLIYEVTSRKMMPLLKRSIATEDGRSTISDCGDMIRIRRESSTFTFRDFTGDIRDRLYSSHWGFEKVR